MSQSNSDSRLFATFVQGLVRILDAENHDWRLDSFITVDGSYTHTKSDALRAMKAL